jgi:hypothetical protein
MYSDSFCFRGRLGLGENNNNMEDREKIKSVRNANKRDGSKNVGYTYYYDPHTI